MEKKILSFVLAIIIMLSVAPMSAFAAGIYPESSHDYENNFDHTWEYSGSTKAKSLSITFDDRCETEEKWDYVTIYDKNGELKYVFDGTSMAGETISLNGNRFKIRLTTDGSVTRYGFKIVKIVENNFTVREPDDQPLEPTAKRPTELNSERVINFDNNVYIINDKYPEIVLENHSVMESVYVGRYYQASYYMISDDAGLWEVTVDDDYYYFNVNRIGEDFKTLGKNFEFLALDKNGNCYDLENNTKIAKNIVDINGRFLLSTTGKLFYASYDEDLYECASNVKEIIQTVWGDECVVLKNNGKTCFISYEYEEGGYAERIISNRSFKELAIYYGDYYFTDLDSRLWKVTYDYDTESYSERSVDTNSKFTVEDNGHESVGYIKNGNRLNLFSDMVNGNAPATPFATNIQKAGLRCYLTNSNDLYVCRFENEGRYRFARMSSDGTMVRLMSNVADFTDIGYGMILFTRTDGSVWRYEHGLAKKILSPSNDGSDGILVNHELTLQYRSSTHLQARIFEGETVTWESFDPDIVSVDGNGTITSERHFGVNPGSATIRIAVSDPNGYSYWDYCEVKVEYAWWQWLIKIALFGWIWY